MAFLEELGASVTQPIAQLVGGVWNALPGIIGAILVLVVGYVVALLVHWLVAKGLEKVNFDKWIVKNTDLDKFIGKASLAEFIAVIAKWYTFILFLPPAADILSTKLAVFLMLVAKWIPQLIAALVIALLGVVAAEYVVQIVRKSKIKGANMVAIASRVVILIFTAIVALDHAGLEISVAENSFLIILGGVMLGGALAFGIGFGQALKDDAKKMIKNIKGK